MLTRVLYRRCIVTIEYFDYDLYEKKRAFSRKIRFRRRQNDMMYEYVLGPAPIVQVYVQGVCPGNGTPEAQAGAGVWFAENHPWNASLTVPGDQNYNNAQLYAAVMAVEIVCNYSDVRDIQLMTNSLSLINFMTLGIEKWKRNGWLNCKGTTVANANMLKQLDKNLAFLRSFGLVYVKEQTNHCIQEAYKLAEWGAL